MDRKDKLTRRREETVNKIKVLYFLRMINHVSLQGSGFIVSHIQVHLHFCNIPPNAGELQH